MSAERTDVLIVGAGLAGARTAESLRAAASTAGSVAGAEPHAPYERPALSKEFLLGERPAADLQAAAGRVLGRRGNRAPDRQPPSRASTSADREAVVGDQVVRWRQLVLATGAARSPPGRVRGSRQRAPPAHPRRCRPPGRRARARGATRDRRRRLRRPRGGLRSAATRRGR